MNVWHYETKTYDELGDWRSLASSADRRGMTLIVTVRARIANERCWKVKDRHFDQAIWNPASKRCRTRRASSLRHNLTLSWTKANSNLIRKGSFSLGYRDTSKTTSWANWIFQIRLRRTWKQKERDFNRI